MRSKSFFYVTLGILALATAYHLGANRATAQGAGAAALNGTISAASLHYCGGNCVCAVVGRTFYLNGAPLPNYPTVPGTEPVIAIGTGAYGELKVMLANGDWYTLAGSNFEGPWTYGGNVLGSPTSSNPSTFGALKAKYR